MGNRADECRIPRSTSARGRAATERLHFVRGYVEGFGQARQVGKPMFVFFTAQGCGYCQEMADEVLTNEQVVGLSERFVCILVDADSEPDVCRQFRVRGYPTVQFMSPRGVPLNRITGKTRAERVVGQMQAALQATASRRQHTARTALR